MTFNHSELNQLSKLAVSAALAAGEVIQNYRLSDVAVHYKNKNTNTSTAGQVVTEVDHRAQAAILAILQPSCAQYNLAFLSEELPDNGERKNTPAFWSIDPMDGTLSFTQNIPGYSVSIALVANDGTPLIGVVYDPVEQTLYQSIVGQGAFKNNQPLRIAEVNKNNPLILRTDISFQDHPWFTKTKRGLNKIASSSGFNGSEIHYRNGAVLNACTLLESPHICYFKYPRHSNNGGSLWDYAASACIYREAGAVATDILGEPMALNRLDSTFMNHRGIIFAADKGLADYIMALYQNLIIE
ncbi:MAG: inositol monophosphatase [Gammaproteobacteria bacterium]